MRHLSSIVLLAFAFACTGCVYCENGLCSPGESEAVFDGALLGEWVPVEPKPEKGQEFYLQIVRDAPTSKAYRITVVGPAETKPAVAPLTFRAYQTKLGNAWFLDAVLPPDPGSGLGYTHHLILSVDMKIPELIARPLSERFVKAHPDALPRTLTGNSLGIEFTKVTATTRELRDFVRNHATNDAAWDGPGVKLRHREQPHK
jgi:hypothetical protein